MPNARVMHWPEFITWAGIKGDFLAEVPIGHFFIDFPHPVIIKLPSEVMKLEHNAIGELVSILATAAGAFVVSDFASFKKFIFLPIQVLFPISTAIAFIHKIQKKLTMSPVYSTLSNSFRNLKS